MFTEYNHSVPTYHLSKAETEKLKKDKYLEVDGICFVIIDNECRVYKLFDGWDVIHLNSERGVDNEV